MKKQGFTHQSFSKKNLGGFTLIELLVVIAIIGLLSSIVLVAMGGARKSGKDGAIKATMNSIRSMAELQYSQNNTYSGLTGRADYVDATAEIGANGGTLTPQVPATGATAYCIEVTLNDTTSWCIDSKGYVGAIADCEGTNYDCATP